MTPTQKALLRVLQEQADKKGRVEIEPKPRGRERVVGTSTVANNATFRTLCNAGYLVDNDGYWLIRGRDRDYVQLTKQGHDA